MLNGVGDLVTVVIDKVEVPNASFASVFTSKVSCAVVPREGRKGELSSPQESIKARIS